MNLTVFLIGLALAIFGSVYDEFRRTSYLSTKTYFFATLIGFVLMAFSFMPMQMIYSTLAIFASSGLLIFIGMRWGFNGFWNIACCGAALLVLYFFVNICVIG